MNLLLYNRFVMDFQLTNPNYNCTVVRINKLKELEWCDNVAWYEMFWLQAIVSRDLKLWDLYLLFSVEVEIDQQYLSENNLFRDGARNKDPEAKWYCESHRRVRAIKFRWHKSSALVMPLSSLNYLWDTSNLREWDCFNKIWWIIICQKYIAPCRNQWNSIKWSSKTSPRIDNKTYPEHLDSANYWRSIDQFSDNDIVVVTQKLHWSSIRMGNVLVRKNLSWIDEFLIKLWIKIELKEYDWVYASRRVIQNSTKLYTWFYKNNIWKIINDKYKDLIPKDRIIYWEIIGWDWDKPIQRWYTYWLLKWECELYVYRISICNQDWIAIDLSWEWVKKFCDQSGMKYCAELWKGNHWELIINNRMNKQLQKDWYMQCLPLSDKWTFDEWVIIRREWIVPFLTKAKCSNFLDFESKVLDSWEIDLESSESI